MCIPIANQERNCHRMLGSFYQQDRNRVREYSHTQLKKYDDNTEKIRKLKQNGPTALQVPLNQNQQNQQIHYRLMQKDHQKGPKMDLMTENHLICCWVVVRVVEEQAQVEAVCFSQVVMLDLDCLDDLEEDRLLWVHVTRQKDHIQKDPCHPVNMLHKLSVLI